MRAFAALLLAGLLNVTNAAPAAAQNADRLLHSCELIEREASASRDAAFSLGYGQNECWDFMAGTLQYALLADADGKRLLTVCPAATTRIADAVRVFVDYARTHREKLDLKAAEVAYAAMKEAFPCKDPMKEDGSRKPAELATSLRLRFDENGKAEEIDRQNLNWYVAETDGPSIPVKAPFYGDCANGEQPFVYKPRLPPPANARSANYFDTGYCLEKSKNLIFVLSFEKPMSFKKIWIVAKGARAPHWDGRLLSDKLAVISIRAGLKNADLEISLVH